MNERIKALELISHCEGCNDEAISGLTNGFIDCHSPAGFAVTYFDMPSCDNEVVNSCVKHV
ncbi:hypothetical protein ACMC5U_00225 [Deferribacteres bacterium DY0609]|uniref:hypothetical protein n=1 Tax=Denitrovibrio acetiphilus TaxID=118000 RepID=UPI00145D591C|nr:hypothetical protein [Denitrovibrio acetiphilus]